LPEQDPTKFALIIMAAIGILKGVAGGNGIRLQSLAGVFAMRRGGLRKPA
jgi:hypothetical protein